MKNAALMKDGFLASQAVACGLDSRDVAGTVMDRVVDAMGYADSASRTLVADGAKAAEAEGCRPLADEHRRQLEATWAGLKRKAGVLNR
jgi:hypothetical protein